MSILGALIPISLFLGALGLAAFIWCIRTGQFDDTDVFEDWDDGGDPSLEDPGAP